MVSDNTRVSNKGSRGLEEWKQAIRLGIRYRTIYGRAKDWGVYKNYYRGYYKKGTVPVNIIYAIGRSLVPQIYFRTPRVSVIAAKPGYTMHARVVERIDNWMIKEVALKRQLKSMIQDCYTCGRAPGVLGYDSEYGYNPEFAADEIEGSLTQFSKKGEKIEYNYNVSPGMPWFLRCSPLDYVVPWGTGPSVGPELTESQWFAFRKMRPLRDIMEDPKYKNKSKLKAAFKSRLDDSSGDNKIHHEDHKAEWVELFQIHDQRSGKVLVISLDHDQFLRDEFDELQVEGLPSRVIGFNEDQDYFWWPSDVRQIEQQQLELNDIRTMAKLHRKVALLKVLYDKTALGKQELTKLLDGDPKGAVAIDVGAGGDIRKAVAFFQSHVPPDLALAAKEVREDVREIIGFSRNQMGSFEESSGRRTAHEAEIVRAASMIRVDERRDIMADALESIVRGMNQFVFKNWNAERIIDVVGTDGARYWIRFTGKELRGEFAYKINPEEAQPFNRNVKIAQSEKFIDMATKIPGMDIKYLLESYAAEFDWIDPKLLFPGEGPGRSPEKAMFFGDFLRMGPQAAKGGSRFPGLAQ